MGPDGGFRLTEVRREVLMGALWSLVVSEPACQLEAYYYIKRRAAVQYGYVTDVLRISCKDQR